MMSFFPESYLVSVCIPVYGVEQYIERCARSLFEQTYQNVEYVFVNDCCVDKSIEILEQVSLDYPAKSIRILHHDHNRGLAAARNTAVEAAVGDFIMHVDSDDWLEPDSVEVLMKRQFETGADIVSGDAIAHYSDKEFSLTEPDYTKKNQMIHQMISLSLNHVIWRRVIRRNLYLDNGIRAIEGADIGEDHYTLPRLIYYANSVARVNKTVYHYNCMNGNSYMREGMARRFDAGRYHWDNFSIDVLRDFFKENDENVFQELNRIKIEHSFDSLWGVLKAGDKKAFRSVCIDMLDVEEYADSIGTTPSHLRRISNHYFFYWLLVRIKIVIKKISGVKKYYI